MIGMLTPGETVSINFGQDEHFVFDIQTFMDTTNNQVIKEISKTDLNIDISELIIPYLFRNGFTQTALQFESDSSSSISKSPNFKMDRFTIRKTISDLIINNQIDEAINLVLSSYPNFTVSYDLVFLQLKCLKFAQLIAQKNLIETFNYGKELFKDKYKEIVEKTASLIAYTNPYESPNKHQLSVDFRQEIAKLVDDSLLEYDGLPNESALEGVFRQSVVVTEKAIEEGVSSVKVDLILR